MSVTERAKILRLIIEEAMETRDYKTASKAPELYPKMSFSGKLIKAGTRINHGGKIIKAAADLWDREENSPENAPNLWAKIDYIDGIRIIPEIISAAEAFSLGELGYFIENEKIYKSLIEGNVYNPRVYPAGWEEQK